MGDKNFMSYGDAETVFSEYANAIKSLDPEGGTLDTRLSAVEEVIPSGASASNQLVTANSGQVFVDVNNDSSITLDTMSAHQYKSFGYNASGITNNPCTVYTFHNYYGHLCQICFGANVYVVEIYYRQQHYGSTDWSGWQRLLTNPDLATLSTSTPSSTDKLVTQSSKYKIQTRAWNSAGNRYIKLSNMFTSSAGLMTTTYLITCRNGEAYLMMCGNSDGNTKSTPQVIKLQRGTGKLDANGFYWDADTAEVALMTQGYNIVQVTQIAGERTDFTMGDLSTSNPLTTPTALTVTSLVPTSTVTSGSDAPITSGGVANEINPTLTATFTKHGGLKSGGVTITSCKKIGDNLAVVSGYINTSSVITVGAYQSDIGTLSISGKTVLGTNPTSIFLWSQGQVPQCSSFLYCLIP